MKVLNEVLQNEVMNEVINNSGDFYVESKTIFMLSHLMAYTDKEANKEYFSRLCSDMAERIDDRSIKNSEKTKAVDLLYMENYDALKELISYNPECLFYLTREFLSMELINLVKENSKHSCKQS